MASQDVLLILMPWAPDPTWVSSLEAISPRIQVHSYMIDAGATETPKEIPSEVWKKATVLFTWKAFPTKEQAPRLQYVQLLSAGSNHLFGVPLFEETDVAFCTSNGVHP